MPSCHFFASWRGAVVTVPNPGKSTSEISGDDDEKKPIYQRNNNKKTIKFDSITVFVFPGFLLVAARLLPVMALRRDDLPAFECPARAISLA
jgi:hypothetical protein